MAKVCKVLKFYKWDTESLESQINRLKREQQYILSLMKKDPHDTALVGNFLDVTNRYKDFISKEHVWLKQRAKVFWLTHRGDDIKFLYHSIKERKNRNFIKEIYLEGDNLSKSEDIGKDFSEHYSLLFWSGNGSPTVNMNTLPLGNRVPDNLKAMLIAPFSNEEVLGALKDIT